ncbi:uncharacterized protein METZ01_LOCUS74614 [marine metagenome]|uniref:Uncharacterized protein n=1 Tax=marine metagenome TaxID=408172 RepID=A0A381U0I3_9ZZZZ
MESIFLFCKEATTGSDGRLNIQGVFNELYASDFPARQEQLVLVGVIEWERCTQGRIPFKIDLTGPDGKSVFSIDGYTDVESRPVNSAPAKTQLVLPMEKVMFPVAGQYRVLLTSNDAELFGPSMHLMRSDDVPNP